MCSLARYFDAYSMAGVVGPKSVLVEITKIEDIQEIESTSGSVRCRSLEDAELFERELDDLE